MGKQPSFQFYPGDWMKDPAVRCVSLTARGLWMDMLCLMFEAQPRGYLMLGGKPASVIQLARMVGSTADEVSLLMDELLQAGVATSSEAGVIYSRRMVRDEEIRGKRRKAGKLGGNPVLVKQTRVCLSKTEANRKQRVNQVVNQTFKQKPTPSSSSSSSTTQTTTPLTPQGESEFALNADAGPQKPRAKTVEPDTVAIPADLQPAEASVREWFRYHREIGKPYRHGGLSRVWQMCREIGVEQLDAAVGHSIANGYQGLVAPKGNGPPREPPLCAQSDTEESISEQIREMKARAM